jgi:hypothetical protein
MAVDHRAMRIDHDQGNAAALVVVEPLPPAAWSAVL